NCSAGGSPAAATGPRLRTPSPARPASRPRAMTCASRRTGTAQERPRPSAVDAALALQLLVPPFLEVDVVLVHVVVVEIDELLDLLGREADARVEMGGDHRVGD